MHRIWQNPQSHKRLISFFFFFPFFFLFVWFVLFLLAWHTVRYGFLHMPGPKLGLFWHGHGQSHRAGRTRYHQLLCHIHLFCVQPNPEQPKPQRRPLQLFSSQETLKKSSSLVISDAQCLKPSLHKHGTLQPAYAQALLLSCPPTCLRKRPATAWSITLHLPSIPSTSAWSETPAFAARTYNPSCHATRVLQILPSPNQTTLMNANIRNLLLHLEPSSLITTSHICSLAGSVLCFSHPVQLTRWFHSCQSWEPMPPIRHTPWALSLRTPLIAATLALTDRYVPALQTPQLHRYNFLGEKPVLDT